MMLPSNTPPDGDFVRYVEKLTQANAQVAREAERAHLAVKQSPAVVTQSLRPGSALPSVVPVAAIADPAAALKSLLKEFPVLTHLKWLVVLGIALQILGEVIPAAAYLLVPTMLGYVAWLVVTANQRSSGALFERLREWLRAVADEAKKAQQAQRTQQTPVTRQKPPLPPK